MNDPIPQILLPSLPELKDSGPVSQWMRSLVSVLERSGLRQIPAVPPLLGEERLRVWIRDLTWTLNELIQRVSVQLNSQVQGVGQDLASSSVLKLTHPIHRVTGTTTVSTITPPPGFTGPLFLIPKGVWAWNTAGNIALSGTAVVDKLLLLVFDGQEWFPSYV